MSCHANMPSHCATHTPHLASSSGAMVQEKAKTSNREKSNPATAATVVSGTSPVPGTNPAAGAVATAAGAAVAGAAVAAGDDGTTDAAVSCRRSFEPTCDMYPYVRFWNRQFRPEDCYQSPLRHPNGNTLNSTTYL